MTVIDLVNQWFELANRSDWAGAEKLMSEDFVVVGPAPEPLNRSQFIGMHAAMSQAMPDFSFNHRDLRLEGNKVHATIQITGTHTGDMALPIPGVPMLPASGKSVTHVVEHPVLTVENGFITRLDLAPVANGGVAGLLSQLGFEMKVAAAH